MCGRYVSAANRADLSKLFHADGPGDGVELSPSYNVAPTTKVYAVMQRPAGNGGGREIRAVRWGLVPSWWTPGIDEKTQRPKRMPSWHNARAGRLASAPSWRGPFAKHRAIIPATGYYEWLTGTDEAGKAIKQPYYVHPQDGVLAFAALYERWADPAKDDDDPDRWLWSAAIITHHATWLAGEMNERTPVILPADRIDDWLDPDLTDKQAAQDLITGIEYAPLQVRAVSTAVNKTGRGAARGPDLIEPVDDRGDATLHLIPA